MNDENTADSAGTCGRKKRYAVIGGVVAVLIGLGFTFDLHHRLGRVLTTLQAKQGQMLEYISGLGNAGVAIYVGIYVLACVFFIPGSILTLGAGVLFGVVKGSIVVSLASTLGATCAFLVGRYFARAAIARKIEGNVTFSAIDEAVAGEGWKIVLLTRLSPVFPFNLLNYAFGLTKVRLRDYVLASWIGMMPGTIMYVYIGSLAGSITALGSGDREKSGAEWALTIVGFVATVVVTVVITRMAKRALDQRVSIQPT